MDVFKLARESHAVRWGPKPLMAIYYPKGVVPSSSKLCSNLLMRSIFALFLAISLLNIAEAAESNVLIIKSGSASVYNIIVTATKQRIDHICRKKSNKCRKPSVAVESIRNNKLRRIAQNKKWDLIIAIGTKAAKRLNSYKLRTPTLYSLIPSNSYPSIRSNSSSRHKSAIYINQPIRRQLQLIKSAMPGRKKVGVVLGKYSRIGKQSLKQIMRGMGLKPIVTQVTPNNIGNRLDTIFSRANVLLALPDPTVYNKQTVLKVLLSSYRHRVPVFGYSAAFVKSGATAAIYSTPRNIGHHIGDEVGKYFSNNHGRLSPPAFPKYFTVNTNKSVINSLKLRIPSRKIIKSKIRRAKQ